MDENRENTIEVKNQRQDRSLQRNAIAAIARILWI